MLMALFSYVIAVCNEAVTPEKEQKVGRHRDKTKRPENKSDVKSRRRHRAPAKQRKTADSKNAPAE